MYCWSVLARKALLGDPWYEEEDIEDKEAVIKVSMLYKLAEREEKKLFFYSSLLVRTYVGVVKMLEDLEICK